MGKLIYPPATVIIADKCASPGCMQDATTLVCHPDTKAIISMCEKDANYIAKYPTPEYIVNCPNCRCKFGVN